MARAQAVVVADAEGVIRHWNDDARRLFGHEAGEALGRSLDLIVPPDLRERHWAGLRRAAASGEMKRDRTATNVPVLLQGPRGEVAGFAAVFSERAGGEEAFGPILPLRG
jgi:PAS domain S-box-containing protein